MNTRYENDQWNDLRARLERHADSIQPTPAPLQAVKRRARQRVLRQRALLGATAVIALIGGVVGVLRLSDPQGPSISARTPALSDTAQLADSGLTWTAVEPDSNQALGVMYFQGTEGAAPYLAWSTSPVQSTPPGTPDVPTLYRSDDGISWQVVSDATFSKPPVSARSAVTTDQEMIAFGTAAAAAPVGTKDPGDLVAARSSDRGATWTNEVLPADLRGLRQMAGVTGVNLSTSMANIGDTVVAMVVPWATWSLPDTAEQSCEIAADRMVHCYRVEVSSVTSTTEVPASTTAPDADAPTVRTEPVATTVAPADRASTNEFTPTVTMTLADAGIDPRSVEISGRPQGFVSIAGGPFQVVELPVEAAGTGGEVTLRATPAGFTASFRAWNYLGGLLSPTPLLHSTDGITWSTIGEAPEYFFGALDDGTLLALNETRLLASTNGATWSPVLDVGTAPVGSPGHRVLSTHVGPHGVTLVTAAALDPNWSETVTILHSTDLVHWSRTALPAVGELTGVTRIVDNGSQVLITVAVASPPDPATGKPAPPRTVVLVGTPTS